MQNGSWQGHSVGNLAGETPGANRSGAVAKARPIAHLARLIILKKWAIVQQDFNFSCGL
jgi:hypothetical protein